MVMVRVGIMVRVGVRVRVTDLLESDVRVVDSSNLG